MSYDPAGNYSLPPVYKATPGTTVRSEQHNSPLEDIAQALSSVIVRDGRNGMIGNLPMGGFRITNLGAGTSPTDAATVDQSVLIGEIKEYALKTLPDKYLWCDGSALPSSTPYPLLRQALLNDGSPYGTDGSGNPRVPDFRGRVGAGRDNMGGTSANRLTDKAGGVNGDVLGDTGGAETHTLTVAQIPSHSHDSGTLTAASNGAHSHQVGGTRDAAGLGSNGNYVRNASGAPSLSRTTTDGAHTHDITGSTASAGSGDAHNNVQPTIVINKIIRAAY